MKAIVLALLLISTAALAQPRPPTTPMLILQGTIGACLGHNAELAVRIEQMEAKIAELTVALEKAKETK